MASLFLIQIGCTHDITDEYYLEEKTVINSFLKHGEPAYFEITTNYKTMPEFRIYNGGELSLFENGRFIEKQRSLNRRVEFNSIINVSSEYFIEFKSDNGDILSATTNCGKPIENLSISIDTFLRNPEFGYYYPVLLLEMDNPIGNDYFELGGTYYYRRNKNDKRLWSRNLTFGAQQTFALDSIYNTNIFTDSTFENRTIKQKIYPEHVVSSNTKEWVSDTFFYSISVRNISFSYYQYQRTKFLHRYNQDGDFFTGNSSASPVYSNIKGGLGIFGGFYEVKDSIIVVKP